MIFHSLLNSRTLKEFALSLRHKRRLYYSRRISQIYLKEIQEIKGKSVLNKKIEKEIQTYAKKRFGDEEYGEWLKVYTELRGEFIEGWIPDDFFAYEFLPFLNNEHISHLSELKSFDHALFAPHAIMPIVKKINGLHFGGDGRQLTEALFLDEIHQHGGEVVIKKDNVPSGEGVQFVAANKVSSKYFPSGSDFLVQPSVHQHPDLYKVHKHSVSTVRVTTYINAHGKIVVKHRSLRFGVKDQRMVNQSGMFLFLDNNGVVISNIFNKIGIDVGSSHPDTGMNLRGFKVPGVARSVDVCKQLHLRFPYLRFIAWDLYIDESETPKIIEWNTIFPGMWENEALIGPLWSEDEVNEVLRARG